MYCKSSWYAAQERQQRDDESSSISVNPELPQTCSGCYSECRNSYQQLEEAAMKIESQDGGRSGWNITSLIPSCIDPPFVGTGAWWAKIEKKKKQFVSANEPKVS